jgi:hypothetical protein
MTVKLGRTMLSLVLVGASVWCLGVVQKVHSEEKEAAAKAEGFQPVAPVHDLMEGQEYHYKEIDKQLKEKGKENFKLVRIHANVLAELSNVNQYQADMAKEADYRKWAVEARDLSLALADAAKAKNAEKSHELYREIYTRCTNCHDKYQ